MNKAATIEHEVLPQHVGAQGHLVPTNAAVPMIRNDAATMLEVIAKVASDPTVDVNKLVQLEQMYERMQTRNAKAAYAAALSEMQAELPIIDRKGRIEVRKKDAQGDRTGPIQQSTPYALWEDINEAIRPVMQKHGFALSFKIARDADRVIVTGILTHREGHSEDAVMSLPLDTTGSKNNVQAAGSSVSYGKRYTATALLNLTSRGEDDDGKAAGAEAVISDEQADNIRRWVTDTKTNLDKFLEVVGAPSISDIPASKYQMAVALLQAKKAAKKEPS